MLLFWKSTACMKGHIPSLLPYATTTTEVTFSQRNRTLSQGLLMLKGVAASQPTYPRGGGQETGPSPGRRHTTVLFLQLSRLFKTGYSTPGPSWVSLASIRAGQDQGRESASCHLILLFGLKTKGMQASRYGGGWSVGTHNHWLLRIFSTAVRTWVSLMHVDGCWKSPLDSSSGSFSFSASRAKEQHYCAWR